MPKPSTTENRNTRVFQRRNAQIPVALVLPGRKRKVPHFASAVQLSFLGLKVKTDVKLRTGQAVQIVPLTGPCDAVPARVVWFGPPNSAMEGYIGLKYTDPLHARMVS
jgi:hypothetical protein